MESQYQKRRPVGPRRCGRSGATAVYSEISIRLARKRTSNPQRCNVRGNSYFLEPNVGDSLAREMATYRKLNYGAERCGEEIPIEAI